MAAKIDKGGQAEELVRSYFLSIGYFVVRGPKVRMGGEDVSDVDLWLYLRASTLSRERTNVDVKFKSSPKIFERIVWTAGFQRILGLERCVVATKGKDASAKEFGLSHGVQLLDGAFLARLRANKEEVSRINEEELDGMIDVDRQDKLFGSWRTRFTDSKARLLSQLDFDGCNAWLEDCRFFLEAAITQKNAEAARRLSYASIAFFLIGLDYASRHLALEERPARQEGLDEGFRYGARGKRRFDDILDGIATASSQAGEVRKSLEGQLEDQPFEMLAEYFSRTQVVKSLFGLAREFEHAAYESTFADVRRLSPEAKSVVGVLLDFHRMDRSPHLGQA